jgi:two-component system chemotaxis response regulator CheY
MSAASDDPAGQSGPVVLIVDDERSIAAVVAEIVSDMGYTPAVATHGQQALELARAHWPVLVITDLMMPRLNGADLIAALREEARLQARAAPPIILLTAASAHYAQAAGADVILRKPFNLTELEALVRRYAPVSRAAGSDG